jgi:hypothetical protein
VRIENETHKNKISKIKLQITKATTKELSQTKKEKKKETRIIYNATFFLLLLFLFSHFHILYL